MDDATKACIDEILAESKRTKFAKATRSRTDHEHKIWEAVAKAWHSKPMTPPKPAPSYNAFAEDLATMNPKDEIAILSVNQAKACIVLRAPMNFAMVDAIQRAVDKKHCKYDADNKVWEFHPCVLATVKTFLKEHYKDVQVLGVQKQIPATKFDQLISKLDKEDKDRIYRILAGKYHPDKGGNHEIMSLINLVFKG